MAPFLFPFVPPLPLILPLHFFFRRHHRIWNIQEPAELRKNYHVHRMILCTQLQIIENQKVLTLFRASLIKEVLTNKLP